MNNSTDSKLQYQKEDGMILSCITALFLFALVIVVPYVLIIFQHHEIKQLSNRVTALERQAVSNELHEIEGKQE